MMEVYALADHALHCGRSGIFHFYRWGKHRRIIVEQGKLTAEVVHDNGPNKKV